MLIIVHDTEISIETMLLLLIQLQRLLVDKILHLRVILIPNILILFCEIQILIDDEIRDILGNQTELLQDGNGLLREARVIMISDHVIGQQLHDFGVCHFVIIEGVYLPQKVYHFILLAYHLHPSHQLFELFFVDVPQFLLVDLFEKVCEVL